MLNFRLSLSLFLDIFLISESYHGLSSDLIRTFFAGIQERTKVRKMLLNLPQASSRVPKFEDQYKYCHQVKINRR